VRACQDGRTGETDKASKPIGQELNALCSHSSAKEA
jgi:hypothetical protein